MEKEESPIYQRLVHLIKHFESGVQTRFAERVGIPTGIVGGMLGKKKVKPGFELTGKILQAYPQLNERWLLLGEGEMLKNSPNAGNTPKKKLYNPAELFPDGTSIVEEPNGMVPGEVVERHGQVIQTFSTSPKNTSKHAQLPGLDLVQTVARYGAQIQELRQELTALKERVDKH